MPKPLILTAFFLFTTVLSFAQTDSTDTDAEPSKAKADTAKKVSKFDNFNQKAENLFKYIPVPLYSYSTEAGNIFGLAKFNLIHLSKKDTVSKPSKLSEVVTFSTKGRINASVSTELSLNQDKIMIIGYVNYKRQPEYILGIGNDVSRDSMSQVQYDRFQFVANPMFKIKKNLYLGVAFQLAQYFSVEPDSNSFLIRDNVTGVKGGFEIGLGIAAAYDTRDNRYNPLTGVFVFTNFLGFPSFLGSHYQFSKFQLDCRKYFNPWLKHVIALQAYTSASGGEVPFYELSLLGGDSRMRGYYQGAIRDKVLVDCQVEYRMPVWNIFGVTGFIGTGRVAPNYSELSLDGFHLAYGGGIRIRVDSKNNTNLRFDMGFGPHNVSGFYINFAEAF